RRCSSAPRFPCTTLFRSSIEDLLLQAAEKKRLEEELRIAHEIQMSLLPQGPLAMRGLSVAALCVPAREVGGDYYDFLPLGEERRSEEHTSELQSRVDLVC